MAPQAEPAPDAIRLESQKIKRLRILVDLVTSLIRQGDMPLTEAVRLVRAVRKQALLLFPGREKTYDLLYAPRFARVLRETYRIESEG